MHFSTEENMILTKKNDLHVDEILNRENASSAQNICFSIDKCINKSVTNIQNLHDHLSKLFLYMYVHQYLSSSLSTMIG